MDYLDYFLYMYQVPFFIFLLISVQSRPFFFYSGEKKERLLEILICLSNIKKEKRKKQKKN